MVKILSLSLLEMLMFGLDFEVNALSKYSSLVWFADGGNKIVYPIFLPSFEQFIKNIFQMGLCLTNSLEENGPLI